MAPVCHHHIEYAFHILTFQVKNVGKWVVFYPFLEKAANSDLIQNMLSLPVSTSIFMESIMKSSRPEQKPAAQNNENNGFQCP
jgi:hypothetical protein